MYRTSFNCLRAEQPLEKAICTTGALASLDRELSQRYSTLRGTLSQELRQRLRIEQRQWLRKRNQKCGDASDMGGCLDTVYRQRINELVEWKSK
ncbi:MAG: lysozyme inhibitor LprI family protein [Candidatus Pacearchaeota archaeon]|nr:lysozyme inhibitor LprI family protein [Candidatus Pacearchaeota archaeon]